jgi:hypothetical protein
MAEPNEKQPLIIKRRKVVMDAPHHGGAWKVAIRVPFLGLAPYSGTDHDEGRRRPCEVSF